MVYVFKIWVLLYVDKNICLFNGYKITIVINVHPQLYRKLIYKKKRVIFPLSSLGQQGLLSLTWCKDHIQMIGLGQLSILLSWHEINTQTKPPLWWTSLWIMALTQSKEVEDIFAQQVSLQTQGIHKRLTRVHFTYYKLRNTNILSIPWKFSDNHQLFNSLEPIFSFELHKFLVP